MAILADALVRNVDPKKRNLAYFFMQEFVWPLGLDVIIGMPRTNFYRLARPYHCFKLDLLDSYFYLDFSARKTQPVYHQSDVQVDQSIRWKSLNLFSDYYLMRSYDVDLLEVPLCSTNMFTNAKSLSLLFQHIFFMNQQKTLENGLPNTSLKGVIFKTSTLNWLLSSSTENVYDPVLERYVDYNQAGLIVQKSPKGTEMIGLWDDIMGQMVVYDKKYNMSLAYLTNHAHCRSLKRDFILKTLVDGVYDSI